MMLLIGLSGKAGAGKDTVASLILENLTGYRTAFADPLRAAAKAIFCLTDEQMQDRALKEKEVPYWGRSPREILQLLGTESVRGVFGPEAWVKRAELHLQALIEQERSEPFASDALIFTDCRFPQEAQWIREQGGVVLHIDRPGLEAVGISGHASEQPLPDALIDIILINNDQTGLAGLADLVREVVNEDLRPMLSKHRFSRRLIA